VLKVERGRKEYRLGTALAELRVYGLSPLRRTARWSANAAATHLIAAVNGDWFNLSPGNYQGVMRGIHIQEGELVSAPRPHYASLWVDAEGNPKIARVASKLRVVWPDGKTETPLGLNEQRKDGAAVLYAPSMGLHPRDRRTVLATTRTMGGRELILERDGEGPWLPLKVGKPCAARVREVREGGNTPLSKDALILSAGPTLAPKLPAVKAGDTLKIIVETEPDLSGVRTAIGGGLVLMADGKLGDLGKSGQPRHPRTAFGWNDDHLFFFVVDGRQFGLSVGMTYHELGAMVERYGCTDAMALDGGGSSAMWITRMGIVNSPSDGEQRPIGNALMLVRDPQP